MAKIKDISKVGKVASATTVTPMSLEDIKEQIKKLNALKKVHPDFVPTEPKAHNEAKKRDIQKILNRMCTRNGVLTIIRSLYAKGDIVPSEWTDKDFNVKQFEYCLKGTKQFKQFLSSNDTNKARIEWEQGNIMVLTAVNQLVSVAILSQGTFAKRQASK